MLLLLAGIGLEWTRRVCTQLDIRCNNAGEMVAKAHDLVATYTKVSGAWLCVHTWFFSRTEGMYGLQLPTYPPTQRAAHTSIALCACWRRSPNESLSTGVSFTKVHFNPPPPHFSPCLISCSSLYNEGEVFNTHIFLFPFSNTVPPRCEIRWGSPKSEF